MNSRCINGIICYSPKTIEELIITAVELNAILVAVNAEKILNSTEDSRRIINNNLGYPDGIGAVWALQTKGLKDAFKIPGCELWLHIIRMYQMDKSFYFIGGTDEVIQQTIAKLKFEFPFLQIVNYRNGYFENSHQIDTLLEDICKNKPDVIFVAMGSPRQELLMDEMRRIHPAVYQGLGGSFDVYIGNVLRAPTFYINNNLEWAYRLIKQPTRIKRQIKLLKFYILLKLKRL